MSKPTIHLRWKKRPGFGFLAEFELALPLPDYDIRRGERLKGKFIRRFILGGVTKTSKEPQRNRRVPFADAEKIGLDTSRAYLELRWEDRSHDTEWGKFCHYELIVPMTDGPALRAALGGTKVGGGAPRAPIGADGTVDTPFRDGAHARWDSKALGIKAFAVYEATRTELKPAQNEQKETKYSPT